MGWNVAKDRMYVFQEANADTGNTSLVPFGNTFQVPAKNEEEARRWLPDSLNGTSWALVFEKEMG